MLLRDGHQGQDQILMEVGLHGSPVQTTQGSRERSLGTSVCLGVDPFVGGLLLLTYPRLFTIISAL